MKVWFHLHAASRILSKRRGPSLRMFLVALIGSLWCVLGAGWCLSEWREVERKAGEIDVDVLVSESAQEFEVSSMVTDLQRRQAVTRASALSSEEVWQEFIGELHIADNDLRKAATTPRLVRIRMAPSNVSVVAIERFVVTIEQSWPHVAEHIAWPSSLVSLIERGRRNVIVLGSTAGLLSIFLFFFALAYAFRAEIDSAGADLSVEAVLGATPFWAATPHILVGILAGGVGLAVTLTAVFFGWDYAVEYIPTLANVKPNELVLFVCAMFPFAALLSLWQSVSAVRAAGVR